MAKAKEKLKAKMPDEPITVAVQSPLTFKLDYDFERYSSGSMRMSISDVVAKVTEDDKEIGSIGAALGGGIFVQIGKDREWFIGYDAIWAAAVEADRRYLHDAPAAD